MPRLTLCKHCAAARPPTPPPITSARRIAIQGAEYSLVEVATTTPVVVVVHSAAKDYQPAPLGQMVGHLCEGHSGTIEESASLSKGRTVRSFNAI